VDIYSLLRLLGPFPQYIPAFNVRRTHRVPLALGAIANDCVEAAAQIKRLVGETCDDAGVHVFCAGALETPVHEWLGEPSLLVRGVDAAEVEVPVVGAGQAVGGAFPVMLKERIGVLENCCSGGVDGAVVRGGKRCKGIVTWGFPFLHNLLCAFVVALSFPGSLAYDFLGAILADGCDNDDLAWVLEGFSGSEVPEYLRVVWILVPVGVDVVPEQPLLEECCSTHSGYGWLILGCCEAYGHLGKGCAGLSIERGHDAG
jgi:hypothetical protein